jgi:hypothetical protein
MDSLAEVMLDELSLEFKVQGLAGSLKTYSR